MNSDLMKAILAMDSYNRGYDFKVDGLEYQDRNAENTSPVYIGEAVISYDSGLLGKLEDESFVDEQKSFYAVSYTYGSETIISYRGTDTALDIITGWTLGVGIYSSDQAILATKFYQSVLANDSNPDNNIFDNNISFTGHSLVEV